MNTICLCDVIFVKYASHAIDGGNCCVYGLTTNIYLRTLAEHSHTTPFDGWEWERDGTTTNTNTHTQQTMYTRITHKNHFIYNLMRVKDNNDWNASAADGKCVHKYIGIFVRGYTVPYSFYSIQFIELRAIEN